MFRFDDVQKTLSKTSQNFFRISNFIKKHPGNFILINNGFQGFFGFITTLLIAKFLTPYEQGQYFFIASIVAFLLISDLGFSSLLLVLFGRLSNIKRLILYFNVRKFYKVFAGISFLISFCIILFPVSEIEIIGIFFAAVVIQLSWFVKLKLIYLESSSYVKKSYLIKIFHLIITYPVIFLCIASGYFYLSQFIFWLFFSLFIFFLKPIGEDFKLNKKNTNLTIFKFLQRDEFLIFFKSVFELFSNYYFLYVPVIFTRYLFSTEVSGKFGISLIVLNFILVASSSWFKSQVPVTLNSYGSNLWYENLSRLKFFFFQSIFIFIFIFGIFLLFISIFNLQDRFLDINNLILYACIFVFYHYLLYQLIIFRANLKDNYSIPLFIIQFLLIPLIFIFAEFLSVQMFIFINFIPYLFVFFYIRFYLFRTKKLN